MTRQVTKSVICSAIVALLVVLVMGADEIFAENEQYGVIGELTELLEGAEAAILSTQGEIEPAIDQSATLRTEFIVAQVAYLEAFDEVIQKQIL